MVHYIEDNAGHLFVWDGDQGYADLERTPDGEGVAEIWAAANGDTGDWAVPMIDKEPVGAVVAEADKRGDITIYPHRMGTAARRKFALA